jgi:hypothetical protein
MQNSVKQEVVFDQEMNEKRLCLYRATAKQKKNQLLLIDDDCCIAAFTLQLSQLAPHMKYLQ